jgi:8-oxo-dGTP diphosphatase
MATRARVRAAGGVIVRRTTGSEPELPSTAHIDSKGRLKEVRDRLMRPVGGEAAPHNEVDAVRWVPLARAARLLTYRRDRDLPGSLPSSGRA